MTQAPTPPPARAAEYSRFVLGVALIALQIAAIAYARGVEARYFCWAPYDRISLFRLDVEVDGHRLTDDAVQRRYRLRNPRRDNRSIQHLIDIVRQYETTYGRADSARIVLTYTTNGVAAPPWHWP